MINKDYNRVFNVLNYCFKNNYFLEQAFIRECAKNKISNKELIVIGENIINEILTCDLKSVSKIDKLDEIKSYLWLPVKSFYLLEYIECGEENIVQTFDDNNVKIEIYYAIIGAIALDSNYNYEIIKNTLYSTFDINIDLIIDVEKNNYIYYIRYFMLKAYLNEFAEEYHNNNDICTLILETEWKCCGEGNTIFKSRYYAAKNMFKSLVDRGFIEMVI